MEGVGRGSMRRLHDGTDHPPPSTPRLVLCVKFAVSLLPCVQLLLVRHCYSSLYGTFLGNGAKERLDNGVHTHTTSLWLTAQANAHLYRNLLYIRPTGSEVGGGVWRWGDSDSKQSLALCTLQ